MKLMSCTTCALAVAVMVGAPAADAQRRTTPPKKKTTTTKKTTKKKPSTRRTTRRTTRKKPVRRKPTVRKLVGETETLVCSGGWRYSLRETRQEIEPARFARQRALFRDTQFVTKAFAICSTASVKGYTGAYDGMKGVCAGLMVVAQKSQSLSASLFSTNEAQRSAMCNCLTNPVRTKKGPFGNSCESRRSQITTLRRYDQLTAERAELVLASQVCGSVERRTNGTLRAGCVALEKAIEDNYDKSQVSAEAAVKKIVVPRGMFMLTAPLPRNVSDGIVKVREATDGRYLNVVTSNQAAVRSSCGIATLPKNVCSRNVIRPLTFPKLNLSKPGAMFRRSLAVSQASMCNQLALADKNAQTCRSADVYIDERGQLHLNSKLTSSAQRRKATLCIDVSDFDNNHPLMVTLGLDPTLSVPVRVWPGETMHIGHLIRNKVKPQDILKIEVRGKARGISLHEVLRVNGVLVKGRVTPDKVNEACRVARAWVPVVDHEIPIGTPSRQAVIPVKFNRGRDGVTRKIDDDDYVVVWVRDIEPSGSVLVQYADGQAIGFQPPPLLGAETTKGTTPDGVADPNTAVSRLSGGAAGVGQPLVPRRGRYPGSRVLRLGVPKSNHQYDIKVCTTKAGSRGTPAVGDSNLRCSSKANVIVNEKMFVQGDYHLGVRFHFGYSIFPSSPLSDLSLQRTPRALNLGEDVFEVVEGPRARADYDVAVLLAFYPFGRNPRKFSHNPLSKHYWKHSALLAGFTVRKITPWDDFYLGGSLPVANGISLSLLSHFNRRRVTNEAMPGDLLELPGETNPSFDSVFRSRTALVVGFSVGLSLDYDLFERGFLNIWSRLSGKQGQFFQSQ